MPTESPSSIQNGPDRSLDRSTADRAQRPTITSATTNGVERVSARARERARPVQRSTPAGRLTGHAQEVFAWSAVRRTRDQPE